MPTPSKPITLLEGHRTQAELQQREAAEKSLLTGERLTEQPEVKADPVAHQWFINLRRLFGKIEKDDALSSPIINRYCLLQSECSKFQEDDIRLRERLEELEDKRCDIEDNFYFKMMIDIEKQINANDSKLMAKRKMLFDIERESLMTLAAQLRSIPKKVEPKENEGGIKTFLKKRVEGQ